MSRSETVWIVDDDRSIRWVLEKALQQEGMTTQSFDSADGVMSRLARQQPDVIISDIRMPGSSGLDLLAKIREQHPRLPVIIMTAHSDLDSAVASYQGGAFEYLPKPFDVDEAVSLVKRANQHAQEQQGLDVTPILARTPEIIGEAPAMQEVFRAIGRLSHSNITVLINGESGTGKELVAHALHRHSPRAASPFIALNMAAIPKDLMESELFGHEKGAFTGAANLRRGRFEQADGGTLFLDEIGDMPADTQTRLLRVLADGEFYRVGGHTPVKVDVRIIAATHQNLETLVQAGKLREDLFHRLNVIRIHIPRLSDRREDIPTLTRHFLSSAAQELSVEPKLLKTETEHHHDAGIHAPDQARQNRHHHKGRQTRHQHHRTRLLGVETCDIAEKLRQQKSHAIQAAADHKDNRDDAGKARVEQQLEAHNRSFRQLLRHQQQRNAGDGQQAQDDDVSGLEPALAIAFFQHHGQGTEAHREADNPQPVSLEQRLPVSRAFFQPLAEHDQQQCAHRNVQKETPAPAEVLGQGAAQHRPQKRPEQHDQAKHGHADGHLMARQAGRHQHLRSGDHGAAGEALAKPADDHLRQGFAQTAED